MDLSSRFDKYRRLLDIQEGLLVVERNEAIERAKKTEELLKQTIPLLMNALENGLRGDYDGMIVAIQEAVEPCKE